jgi:maltooligosyltrehalose trehalohydrolase
MIDHSDEGLVEATREGRKREFAAFHEAGEPPDPASQETANQSVLSWTERTSGSHADDLALTTTLLQLRDGYDCFRPSRRVGEGGRGVRAFASGSTIAFASRGASDHGLVVVNLGANPVEDDLATICDAVGFAHDEAVRPVLEHNATVESGKKHRATLQLEPYGAWAAVRRERTP